MIAGIFHSGSGIGDQLFRYITVRTLAEEKGYEWGMVHPENFKGESFMKIDKGQTAPLNWPMMPLFNEKAVVENGIDIRSYDPEINFLGENTIIDGCFEDDNYWRHRLPDIAEWLKVEPLEVPDDLCVIGFRGGEYYSDPNLGLPPSYYMEAIEEMQVKGITKFQVHTDDHVLAKQFFPGFEVVENQQISHSKHTNMGLNWRSARYAKYAIIPNSAFFVLPRLLKHLEDPTAVTIAPRYWARRNLGVWARPGSYHREFTYI